MNHNTHPVTRQWSRTGGTALYRLRLCHDPKQRQVDFAGKERRRKD